MTSDAAILIEADIVASTGTMREGAVVTAQGKSQGAGGPLRAREVSAGIVASTERHARYPLFFPSPFG